MRPFAKCLILVWDLLFFFFNLGDDEYGELNDGEYKQKVACLILFHQQSYRVTLLNENLHRQSAHVLQTIRPLSNCAAHSCAEYNT